MDLTAQIEDHRAMRDAAIEMTADATPAARHQWASVAAYHALVVEKLVERSTKGVGGPPEERQ
jgi:hypothetical protein